MNKTLRIALALAATAGATQAIAQVTFYEHENFDGRTFTTSQPVNNLQGAGFNDRASAVVVATNRWEVCEDAQFGGRCVVLRPGRYPSLAAMGLNDRVSSVRAVAANARVDDSRFAPLPVAAQVTFFEQEGFGGRTFTTSQPVRNFKRFGFNDTASSVVVAGDRWEVCDSPRFEGRCAVLRPGRYPSLASMGLNDRVSSVQAVSPTARIEDNRYAPMPVVAAPPADQRYRRRQNERVHQADVTSVRAVMGTPEQRCWVERTEAPQPQAKTNVPGAVIGAVIGGILGHQVGGGSGKDLATAGGAIGGGLLGANVGRIAGAPVTQDVRRCENVTNQTPSYYDVTYSFRGVEHRVQTALPPGRTIAVNDKGEPRA
jgi:uncharacterized protein YcfJ